MVRIPLLALGLAVLASCPGYNPTFVDCKVKCEPMTNACPEALACKNGWCRPKDAVGSCDCSPGQQRTCGGSKGLCNPGVQTCTNQGNWGSCVGEGKPQAEICDNLDNDCNGTVDDGISDAPACPLSKGVCNAARQKCVAGAYSGTCDATDYGPSYEAIETKCDGLDNDCDGAADAKAPAIIATGISEFVFTEYDGGFSLVGIEEPATGGYQLVVQRLTSNLAKRGPTDLISAPAMAGVNNTMTVAARANPAGTTFVAWVERDSDAGVKLSAVESTGIVSTFPTYTNADRQANNALSLGVGPAKVYVSWAAHQTLINGQYFTSYARMVTWDLNDGGIATKDYLSTADGGPATGIDVYAARLSPTGRVMGIRYGQTVTTLTADGGTESTTNTLASVFETSGPRTSSIGLGGRFQFVEVGPVTSSGWTFFNAGFKFPPFIDLPDESGLEFRQDVFSTSQPTTLKTQDDDKITTGNVGRGNNSVLVSWTEEYKTATIGTPYGNGNQARTRNLLSPNNTLFGDLQLGHAGGSTQLIGVVWRDTKTGPGNIWGQMICQP